MRARRAGALGHRSRGPRRRRRRGDPRQQGDRGRSGLAAGPRTRRRHHCACGARQAGAGHLRRIPDALPPHRRPGGVRARGVTGLGLLDADIVFAPDKTLRHARGRVHGYEIHHGQLARSAEDDWLGVGIRRGTVYGTHWHGVLDNNELRRRWLTETGPPGFARRRRHRRPGAARRATRPDGRPADRTPRRRRSIVELLENGPPQRPAIVTTLES